MRIITVYKTGGIYTRDYVERLERAVRANTQVDYEFVCLTDDVTEAYDVPMQQNWPGWWGKLEMFDHSRFPGHNVFIDLDTVIMKDITDVLTRKESLIMMRDHRVTRANSCLMSWTSNMTYVLQEFISNAQGYVDRFRQSPWIGDQAMTEYATIMSARTIHFWQDIMPDDYFVNWTLEDPQHRAAAHLAWWTDGPKPHEIQDPLIDQHWRNR